MRKILIASIFVPAFCVFAFGQNPNCPTISVLGPSNVVHPGDPMTFTANVSNFDLTKIGYKWTVSEGTIIQGQGTAKILVNIEGLDDNAITATVEFLNLPEGCANSASETGVNTVHYVATIIDQMKISSNITNARLDAIVTELRGKPESILYILIDPGEKTSGANVERKQNQIEKYLVKKNIPTDKVVILMGEQKSDNIQFWKVPLGSEPPTP